jgi:hypothetical protein
MSRRDHFVTRSTNSRRQDHFVYRPDLRKHDACLVLPVGVEPTLGRV